jgi:hypothetical protein
VIKAAVKAAKEAEKKVLNNVGKGRVKNGDVLKRLIAR